MQNSRNQQNVPADWIEVYLAANPVEANLLVGLLNAEGIPAGVKGIGVAGGIGELPVDALQMPIYAPEAKKASARAVLKDYERNGQLKHAQSDWTCSECEEVNGSAFEICWSCGYSPIGCQS
ncbi:DUF2007 domain-containing protein [Aliidiomarina sp. B3213]|nr:DUF2007 domain-containing protein [Aliidiomarina sp. B3213]